MARPFRYTFILVLVGLGACLAALSGWHYARASAPVNGPIILVSLDGLRADHLPAYGYRGVRTPAIDTLAADAVVFERAYSNVPQTLPAHVSLLSGRLPFATGVRDSVGFTVKRSERLLHQMLGDRGFETAGIVSSYLLRADTGIANGFRLFDGTWNPSADATRVQALSRDGAESEKIAERWLDSAGDGRAFLFLHLDEPRRAMDAPTRYAQYSPYDARIAYADEIVGRLVRYLKRHQLYDRSTVALVSDHGEGLGDHGETDHGLLLYEEALRVPLILKQPAGEGAGRRVKDPVQLVDIAPTILEFAKAPVPGNLQGQSLRPLLDGSGHLGARVIYSESLYGAYHFGWAPLVSITDGRYRYTKGAREELYAVANDAAASENLAGAKPDAVRAMRRELQKLGVPAPAPDAAVSAGDRERFESAGYVGFRLAGELPFRPDLAIDPSEEVRLVERYREAVDAAVAHNWVAAVDRFRGLTRQDPSAALAWLHLGDAAMHAERHELEADAFRHALDLSGESAAARLGASDAMIKLRQYDEARQQAGAVIESAAADGASRSLAHELLARIALARREPERARAEAALAELADPTRPVGAYVEGRVAYEQARYADAADAFDAALAAIETNKSQPPAGLRYYAADALLHLDRAPEAEYLLLQEIQEYPLNARVRSTLATLYRATGRTTEAAALAQH